MWDVMKVCIIDADLLGREKHRFPNLVCEKLSAYWKARGAEVELKLDYDNLDFYDNVYISKVFTDTEVPKWIQEGVDMDKIEVKLPSNIHVGGTGFFFAKALNLPDEIEHHIPDYHLYDKWIDSEVKRKQEEYYAKDKDFDKSRYMVQFKEYKKYSIGFLTRGCFRKCGFCVNEKYDYVFQHSPLREFYDPNMPKICLLDDNFFGCGKYWKIMLQELIDTGKPFKFKQGLDERLLTEEMCKMLFNAKYDGDYTFAFDNVSDYDLIHRKLQMIRKYTKSPRIKFYVLVGFESIDAVDIENAFIRISLLQSYRCLPYIMRYQNKNETPWKKSKYKGLYITIARWCNQPSIFKKMTFREFCEANQKNIKTPGFICSSMKAMLCFEKEHPDLAKIYFDKRYGDKIEEDIKNE